MILSWEQIDAQNDSNSRYINGCTDSDSLRLVDRYIYNLRNELDLSSEESTQDYSNIYGDCEVFDNNGILDRFIDILSENQILYQTPLTPFTKIIDLMVKPSSIVILFSIVSTGIVINSLNSTKKNRPKERRGFSRYTQARILKRQNHKCVFCRKTLDVIDYDHKNGDRSDNRENSCQALCPNCHAIKTRRELSKN